MATYVYEFNNNDTLVKIANMYNTDVQTLVRLNPWLKDRHGHTVTKPSGIRLSETYEVVYDTIERSIRIGGTVGTAIILDKFPRRGSIHFSIERDGNKLTYEENDFGDFIPLGMANQFNYRYNLMQFTDIKANSILKISYLPKFIVVPILANGAISLEDYWGMIRDSLGVDIHNTSLQLVNSAIDSIGDVEGYDLTQRDIDDMIEKILADTQLEPDSESSVQASLSNRHPWELVTPSNRTQPTNTIRAELVDLIDDYVGGKIPNASLFDTVSIDSFAPNPLVNSTNASIYELQQYNPNNLPNATQQLEMLRAAYGNDFGDGLLNPYKSSWEKKNWSSSLMPKLITGKGIRDYYCAVYIYRSANDYSVIKFPCLPESVDDSVGANYNSMNVVGRSEPYNVYEYTNGRSLTFSFTMHREMETLGTSVEDIVKVMESVVYPNYGGSIAPINVRVYCAGTANTPQIYINGFVSQQSTRWYGPIAEDGKYNVVDLSFTVVESTGNPLSHKDVLNGNHGRNLVR